MAQGLTEVLASLDKKMFELDVLRKQGSGYLSNLNDWFRVELTYNSNAIEGNTLTRSETALILEKGITVQGKTLVEHLEATNHAEAFDYMLELVGGVGEFRRLDLLNLHSLILSKIDDLNAGRFRDFNVVISGSDVELPDHLIVPQLMEEFFELINTPGEVHPVIKAAEAHYRLVRIHPFVDGNGRTARLLMNLLLMSDGYPITVIGNAQRVDYIQALEKADQFDDLEDFHKLVAESVERSLDIYLGNKKPKGVKEDRLLKIGQLAKVCGVPATTIRYWTNEGLLKPFKVSSNGYRWYEESVIEVVRKLRELKDQRMTLEEIREAFKADQ